MSVDLDTVRKVAHLSRIAVDESELPRFQKEMNSILAFAEQLNKVNIEGIEPMVSVVPFLMEMRADGVTDGGYADLVTCNAPETEDHFFLVPKVVE